MDLTKFLLRNGSNWGEVSRVVADTIGRDPNDVLFASGSLVERLGNNSSDVDLYLVTQRQDIRPTFLKTRVIRFRGMTIDVTICPRHELMSLTSRLEDYDLRPRDPKEAHSFSLDDRQLLHRLLVGEAWWNAEEFSTLRARISPRALSRQKLDWALHAAKCLQIDLAGLRAEGDWQTMLIVAQQLLAYTIDGLLAGYCETNPTEKWRIRLLQRLPLDWEHRLPGVPSGLPAAERFILLHHWPMSLNSVSAMGYALRICGFSRKVFPWAAWALSGRKGCDAPLATFHGLGPQQYNEYNKQLDLDVLFVFSEDRFQARRLAEGQKPVDISPRTLSLLCLFDGQTSETIAMRATESLGCNPAEILNDIRSLIAFFNFEAKDIVNEEALKHLLSANQ